MQALLIVSGIICLAAAILGCFGAALDYEGTTSGPFVVRAFLAFVAAVLAIAGTCVPPTTSATWAPKFTQSYSMEYLVAHVPGAAWGPGYALGITTCVLQIVALALYAMEYCWDRHVALHNIIHKRTSA